MAPDGALGGTPGTQSRVLATVSWMRRPRLGFQIAAKCFVICHGWQQGCFRCSRGDRRIISSLLEAGPSGTFEAARAERLGGFCRFLVTFSGFRVRAVRT